MQQLHAFALTGSILGALITFSFLQFPGLLIWCAFIGWACFLHSGADTTLISSVIGSMVLGSVMAWVFSLIFISGMLPFPQPVAGAILVAVIAPTIIIGSSIQLFSVVPASFYGFATTFAYLAQTPGTFTMAAMTELALENAVVIVPVSLVIGSFVGWVQIIGVEQLIAKKEAQ